jgi:hypothetical protein
MSQASSVNIVSPAMLQSIFSLPVPQDRSASSSSESAAPTVPPSSKLPKQKARRINTTFGVVLSSDDIIAELQRQDKEKEEKAAAKAARKRLREEKAQQKQQERVNKTTRTSKGKKERLTTKRGKGTRHPKRTKTQSAQAPGKEMLLKIQLTASKKTKTMKKIMLNGRMSGRMALTNVMMSAGMILHQTGSAACQRGRDRNQPKQKKQKKKTKRTPELL